MSTHAIGSGTRTVSINVPIDEQLTIGRLAFDLGAPSVSHFWRRLALRGLEIEHPETAAKVADIRRRYYGSTMLAVFVLGMLSGTNHDLRRTRTRTTEERIEEAREA